MLIQQYVQEFSEQRPRLIYFLFFLSGALTMLSFAPVGWFAAAPILLLPLLIASFYLPAKKAAKIGFCYGSGLFLTGTYWLYISIHVFGQAPLWVALIIMLGLVMIMGLYYALTAWLIARLTGGHPVTFLLVAPAVWVAVEWIRGWFLSGFPWMSLGYSQIDTSLAGLAPVVGVYGLSLALLISTTAFLVAVISTGRKRTMAVLLAVLPWISGAIFQQLEWTEATGQPVRTTIGQGGVSQERKWAREQFRPTLNLYRSSIDAHPDSELIVWPEVALPATIDQVEYYLDEIEQIAAVGINCTAPRFISSLVAEARSATQKPIVVYPNSGETYDIEKKQWLGETDSQDYAAAAVSWSAAGASIIGGCCRTGPEHIRHVRQILLT